MHACRSTLEDPTGAGAFVALRDTTTILSLQLYWILFLVTGMPLAIVLRERGLAEERSQENHERLRLALEMGRMGVWDWDPRNNSVTWSKECFLIAGLEPFSVVPTYEVWAATVHPVDLAFAEAAIRRSIDQRTDYRISYRLVRPDGEIRWVMARARVMFDRDTCVRMMGVLTDVTETTQKEAALRTSEQRYRDVVDSQAELVCRYLSDTTLTFVNQAYCRFFGRTREQLIGRSFMELIPEVARDAALNHVAQAFARPGMHVIEHEVLRPDGTIGWQQWSDHAIAGPDGKVTEIQAIGRDITDRKQVEEARRDLSRAARLAMAGQVTAAIAHEINQPLSAILSNVDTAAILLGRPNPSIPKVREILADICTDGVRAGQIIRHIRSFFSKGEVVLEPMDLNDVIRGALPLLSAELNRRQVVLELNLAAVPLRLLGDSVHLKQVLLNLSINAIEAMDDLPPDRRRRLEVRTTGGGAGTIELVVRDTGPGIAPDGLNRVFDSFYTTKTRGMGIGLSLTRSLVEAHGGQIVLAETSPAGTTFRMSFPAAPTA